MKKNIENQPGGDFLLYQTEDGQTRLETRMTGDTVWLSLGQMSTLFERDKSVISRHIRNIFEEGELQPDGTVAKFATVQTEGQKSVSRPRKEDAAIAKNYLNPDELDILNRIVAGYLEFAELQARNRKPMTMQNWIGKLDDFLRLGERDILTHAGRITHQEALTKAEQEYEKFRQQQLEEPSRVELDFEQAIKRLPSGKPEKKK
jgi:hypothetical protein